MKLFAAALLVVAPLVAFADGVPDSTFGDGGSLTIAFPPVEDVAEQVMDGVVDAQGRYVAVGFAHNAETAPKFSAQISRHLASGTPDTSVNGSGVIRFNDGAAGDMFLFAVASRGDKVVVAGMTNKVGSDQLVVCRFDSDLDMQADRIAEVCLPYNVPVEVGMQRKTMDVLILPDDKILVLSAEPGDKKSYRLTRIQSNGAIDLTFGECGCGYVYNDGLFENKLEPAAMALDPVSGAIVVASFETILSSEVVVTRHLENGAIDKSFSGDGYVPVRFDVAAKSSFPFAIASSTDRPSDIAVLPEDGSVLLLASIIPVPEQDDEEIVPSRFERVGVAKILVDGTFEQGFGIQGDRAIINFSGLADAWSSPGALTLLPDGRILAGGTCTNCNGTSNPDFAAMRLLANGRIDKDWGYPDKLFDGVVVTLGDEDDISAAQVTAMAIDNDRVVMFGYRLFDPLIDQPRADGVIARIVPQLSGSIFADAFEGG